MIWDVKKYLHLDPVYRLVTRAMPAAAAGRIDLLRPSFRSSWGGPMNGQEFRRAIVRSLAREIAFDRVIETGTYRGSSTEFLRDVFGVPVETVEGDPRLYTYSRNRLAFDPAVTVTLGDSRDFLREIAGRGDVKMPFIYLDAHWEEDLPLREELEIIEPAWDRAVVMIDDFAVPGDDGYTFDDYGPGRALTLDYLPPMPDWSLRFPAAPSSAETGARRGCCILLSPALAHVRVPELREESSPG
jgi:hypothetical protein